MEMAPEMNGWTAAIIRTWPMWWIVLSPIEQANTATCSAARCGAPRIDLFSSM